jgi:ABC-type antimicrobial peptide transport system permease subunit
LPSGQQSIKLVPLKDTKVDPAIRKSFLILQAVVVLLLAIACANTANMSLARSMLRQKEFAVRLAIGGSRWRVLRLVLTESMLLGFLGGSVGLLFATWIVNWMTAAKR